MPPHVGRNDNTTLTLLGSARSKQIPPPTSYSSSEDEEEWEDAVDGEDVDDNDEKRMKRERKESVQSHHNQLVIPIASSLPRSESGKSV